MIPISLTIQGIFSYQELQKIDFKNLLADQIFGIFGTVGSGKSSILEAITFALYGQLEKMNSRDGIAYNMMNLKSNKLLIDFAFSDDNADEFRFVIKGKRNSKNFEDVGTFDKKQYKKQDGEWIAGEYNAEDIIGLSYDNFKRTIIIPQGKFMEFLQLGDADRTKMMKDIFGLEKYDLSFKVGVLEKENNSIIDNIKGQLESFQSITKEELDDKKIKLEKENNRKTLLVSKIEEQQEILKALESVKVLFEDLSDKRIKLNTLQSQREVIEELKKEIQDFEYCQLHFKALFDNKANIGEKIDELNIRLNELKNKIEKSVKQLEQKEELFEEVKKDFLKVGEWELKAADYKRIIEIKEIELDLLKRENDIEILKNKINKQFEKKREADEEVSILKGEISTLETQTSNIKVLYEIQQWFTNRDYKIGESNKVQKSLDLARKNLEKTLQKKNSIIPENEIFSIDKSADIDTVIAFIEEKKVIADKEIKELTNKLQDIKVRQQLKEYSASLEDGNACPICGSLEHPNPINIEHIDDELNAVEKEIHRVSNMVSRLFEYRNSFIEIKKDIAREKQSIDDLIAENDKNNQLINEFEKTFSWSKYSINDSQKVDLEVKTIDKLIADLKKKREQLQNKEKSINSFEEWHKKQQEELSNLDNGLSRIDGKKQQLVSQLEYVSLADFISTDRKDISYQKVLIEDKIKETKEKYERLENEISQIKELRIANLATFESEEKHLLALNKDIDEINENIKLAIDNSDYNSEKEIITVLSQTLNIEKQKREIADFEKLYEQLQIGIEELEKKLEGKSFDKEKYENVLLQLDNLKEENDDLQASIGALINQIQDLNDKLIIKKKLEKDLKLKQARAEDINTLKKLFKGAGFVKFVSSVYMRQLIEYANKRFNKLTKQSLSLALNSKGSFDVIDYLNNGRLRSVKTLSGGQLFQASLSLALALAGSVQKQNNANKNFFFLDEGFGTQDEESLRLVFETIKSLRNENRVVGIISHVDELQNEINTYLKIVKDEDRGSLIQTSW
jgi:exonuclease SbcC